MNELKSESELVVICFQLASLSQYYHQIISLSNFYYKSTWLLPLPYIMSLGTKKIVFDPGRW